MKLVVCGSMFFSKEMIDIGKKLAASGHQVILPRNCRDYANCQLPTENRYNSIKNKIDHDLIIDYFKQIGDSDGVLIANFDKNGIANYIGGNVFLEIGFAHVLGKKIYLLNDIPEIGYQDEIIAMRPVTLKDDLNKIGE